MSSVHTGIIFGVIILEFAILSFPQGRGIYESKIYILGLKNVNISVCLNSHANSF